MENVETINSLYKKPKVTAVDVIKLIIRGILDFICFLLVLVGILFSIVSFNCKNQNTPPSMFGYSNLQVVSGSMVKSGFNIGDNVLVRATNTDTLKDGDIIAFYDYYPSYKNFDITGCKRIMPDTISDKTYEVSFKQAFGFYSDEIKTAAKAESTLVFHHIRNVWEDENGVRWFQTYGSSNTVDDTWWIREDYILGSYVDTDSASILSHVLNWLSSTLALLLSLLLPMIILTGFILTDCITEIKNTFLEADVLDGIRQITDPKCIKRNIGFGMNKKNKLKIYKLAITPEEKAVYASLLWKKDQMPANIKEEIGIPLSLNKVKEIMSENPNLEHITIPQSQDNSTPIQDVQANTTESESQNVETKSESQNIEQTLIQDNTENN